MSPVMDRDYDRDLVRHNHSHSFSGGIPMWDSSDPERAPPPLPLNPGGSGSPKLTTRPNTSAAIMQVAKALEEKARESAPASSYTVNPMPLQSKSPDRALVKGNHHKRMQSLQPNSVRDLRSYLDTHRSPDRSPERPPTRSATPPRQTDRDYFGKDAGVSPLQLHTPTPASRYDLKDTPTLRPSHRSIYGENTPPSATMMALQTMSIPAHILDPPPASTTNTPSPSRSPAQPAQAQAQAQAQSQPQPMESISSQLLSITTIVSNLQKDMSQLSRRSKDNAVDLISLKEATTTRDEDIRQSLKDLLQTMTQKQQEAAEAAASKPAPQSAPAETPRVSSLNLEDPHMTPIKQFTFPRMSSPNTWTDEMIGSPNPYSVEGAASVAMLEKIIREMVTKDGQERLISSLQKIVDQATGDTAKKVAELLEYVKQGSATSTLHSPGSGQLTRTLSMGSSLNGSVDAGKSCYSLKAADFVGDEMLKFLRKIKDSVAEAGSVTMATKTLVQDLRGEVLGVGRELARKIEEAEQAQSAEAIDDDHQPTPDISVIVQEGLTNLKDHIDKVMRERRRQSNSSIVTRNTVDSGEVYEVMKQALIERGLAHESAPGAPLDREAIVAAVREAYDSVEIKPNVEIQQVGLERDEILQCLREGLQDYNGSGTVTKEQIEEIVHDSLQQIKLPPPINEVHEIREEILMTVRECLDELKPSLASQPPAAEALSREVVLEVIKEALSDHQFGPQELDIPSEPIFDAVRAGLEACEPQLTAQNEAAVQRLQSLIDEMRTEFKESSSAAGSDTEKVLDALRDGLESLRTEIQGFAEKPQDASQKDEIVNSIRAELDVLRENVQGYVAEGPRGDQAWSREDMVAHLKSEFEDLHEKLSSQFVPAAKDKEEILSAINAGFEEMKSQVALREEGPESNDEINEAIKHEFEQLKEVVLGDASSHKNDVLEKLQAGLDGLHVALGETTTSTSSNEEVLACLKEEFEQLRETLGTTLVKADGTANKDEIIGAVKELIDDLRSTQATASKDNATSIQSELATLKESVCNALVPAGDNDKAQILEALRASLEEIKSHSQSAGMNAELLEVFRGELEQIRVSDGITRQHSRADTEEVLEAVRLGLDDLQSHLTKKLDNPDRQNSATSEIIDALNEGLEGVRTDITKLTDKPVDMSVSHEILDTLKEGLASLRADIQELKSQREVVEVQGSSDAQKVEEDVAPAGNELALVDDPAIQAVSGEIVQESPAQETMEEPTNSETVEEPTSPETAEEPAAETATAEPSSNGVVEESLRRNDLENMELILSQIQDRIEAMDANIHNVAPAAEQAAAPDAVVKEDLNAIEELLKDVQIAVLTLQERETPPPVLEGFARKEDTDAIETLLANTKAKIEELVLPDPATAITKENLDDVELVVRTTSEALDALTKKIEEEGATKADVTVVQVIADDIKQALDEMKTAKPDDEADPRAKKSDVDAVVLLIDDLKVKIDDLKIPNPDEMPSKAEVEQLTGLIHDFRDSHDKLKDTYEEDIMKTAKNFDDRKQEAEAIVGNIVEVKTALDEMKEEIKTNLIEGGPIASLKDSFKTLEETIGTNNVTADVKELMETVSREFERAHGSIQGLQTDHSEKSALHLEKHDEVKDAIINGFTEKLDDKFNVLMSKYDDAQLMADEQARVMKEKAEGQEKILEATKTMADELRLTIDTLGASITGMNNQFEGVTTSWSTASETVIGKIDETVAKLEEQKAEDKAEHSQTRDEIKNIESIFTSLQSDVTEHHPKFMAALQEIEALVKAHYEHAQKTKEEADEYARNWNEEAKARAMELQSHFENLPKLLPPPVEVPEKYDDAPVQSKLDQILAIEPPEKYDDTPVQSKLDQLLAIEPPDYTPIQSKLDQLLAIEPPEKYDDTPVQSKLDQILAIEPPEKYDDASVQSKLDQILAMEPPEKYDDTPVQSKLDQLLAMEPPEKYDDTPVQSKLDQLLAMEPPEKYDDASVQAKLDQILAVEPPEKYDDTPVQAKLDQILAIEPPEKYDDSPVQSKLDQLLAIEPPEKYDDTSVQSKLDQILAIEPPEKYDDASVQSKLDQILAMEPPEKYDDAPVQSKLDQILAIEPEPKYDDTFVQEKLDKLLGHADEAAQATHQLGRLEEIHAQVKATAAEISEFVAKQNQTIADGNEAKQREAEELALLIERRTAQKECLEADLENLKMEKSAEREQFDTDIECLKAEKERVMQELKEEKERVMLELKEEKERTILELKDEKDSILAIVAALQAERENLANQKVRLTGEVSSLHTALEIRREELHMMDAKADALERRILNGIMDHSRALMIAKGGSKSPSKLKKRMNTGATDEAGNMMPPPSTAATGLSFALKPRPAVRRNGAPQNPANRRILSLSQISGNTPTGAQAYPTANTTLSSSGGIKRSHSVKTPYLRKGSWGSRPSAAIANKENTPLKEEDEIEAEHAQSLAPSIVEEDRQSETGTERRYSIGSRSQYSENYAEGETPGYEERSSYGGEGNEYTCESGSYPTGSDVDRRVSYGSHGKEDLNEDSEYSGDEKEDDELTATLNPSEISAATADNDVLMPTDSEIDHAVEAVKADLYTTPSDSGVETDLPTTDIEGSELVDADYFRRAAEEESTVG